MDEYPVRLECLRLAVQGGGGHADVVERARAYADFLFGGAQGGADRFPLAGESVRFTGGGYPPGFIPGAAGRVAAASFGVSRTSDPE